MFLGRVKGRHLKVLAKKLVERNPGVFTERFADNKLKIKEMRLLEDSREEQNKLAGEITNVVKRRNRPPEEPRYRHQRDFNGRGERSEQLFSERGERREY
ncbi:MAG: hypothetical protein QW343_01055 [Candidatus Norongarragalinales archaeon]